MSGDGGALTPKQERAALHLARGLSVRKTAATINAGERTVFTWLTRPAFKRRVQELWSGMFTRAVGRLANVAAWTVGRLMQLARSNNSAVALGACKALLDNAPRMRDLVDLEERLAAIEERLQQEDVGGRRGRGTT